MLCLYSSCIFFHFQTFLKKLHGAIRAAVKSRGLQTPALEHQQRDDERLLEGGEWWPHMEIGMENSHELDIIYAYSYDCG